MASLARELKLAERTYGADHLYFLLATDSPIELLRNSRVVGYFAMHFSGLLVDIQRIFEAESAAA